LAGGAAVDASVVDSCNSGDNSGTAAFVNDTEFSVGKPNANLTWYSSDGIAPVLLGMTFINSMASPSCITGSSKAGDCGTSTTATEVEDRRLTEMGELRGVTKTDTVTVKADASVVNPTPFKDNTEFIFLEAGDEAEITEIRCCKEIR